VRRIRHLWRDQSGASAVEYGLILALGVGLALLLVYFFGRTLNGARSDVARGGEEPAALHDGGASGGGADGGFILHRTVVIP